MVREYVKSDRCAKDSRRADNSVRDKKEDTDDLLQPRSADHVGHVGDGVAASMCIAEVALHNGAKNNHRKKLTLEKDDGSLNPSDGSKIDNPITLLEDFAIINSLLSSELNAATAEHAR
ncbi:hypothetical protein HG530_006762 [Fusarium avenaceum]|nr:hypothetical protein HG530_006762 [Fusarium avenaceum]